MLRSCGWRPGIVWVHRGPAEIVADINVAVADITVASYYSSAGAFLVGELERLDMRISPLGLALPRRYLRDIEVR